MSRRCACGCGRRCTVSEDWAADGCQQRWLEQQVQPLPAVGRVTGYVAGIVTATVAFDLIGALWL